MTSVSKKTCWLWRSLGSQYVWMDGVKVAQLERSLTVSMRSLCNSGNVRKRWTRVNLQGKKSWTSGSSFFFSCFSCLCGPQPQGTPAILHIPELLHLRKVSDGQQNLWCIYCIVSLYVPLPVWENKSPREQFKLPRGCLEKASMMMLLITNPTWSQLSANRLGYKP